MRRPERPGPRRGVEVGNGLPLWQQPVSYPAVGATQQDDVLRYPPKGYRVLQRQVRIGHGAARWEFAWRETFTWGIKKRAGFRIHPVETPPGVHHNTYLPVAFDDANEPVRAAEIGPNAETTVNGQPVLRAGDTAVLLFGPGVLAVREPIRVVYVIDEPRRRGYAYGTLPGHPLRGEEAFVVEHRDDDSVWLTIRTMSRVSSGGWTLLAPVIRIVQRFVLGRYEHALTGRITE